MHHLIGDVRIAHCRLARAEDGQRRMRHGLLHHSRHRQPAILKKQRALQRVSRVLLAVACKVHYGRIYEGGEDRLHVCGCSWNAQLDQMVARHVCFDFAELSAGGGQRCMAWGFWLYDDHHFERIGGGGKRSEERIECGRVR